MGSGPLGSLLDMEIVVFLITVVKYLEQQLRGLSHITVSESVAHAFLAPCAWAEHHGISACGWRGPDEGERRRKSVLVTVIRQGLA